MDDGSTDHTVQTAEQYREKFAAKGYGYRIIQAVHKNASAAINQGLHYVSGEYLIWPDSDDVLEPESVGKRVEFLKQHPQYQCVRSLSYYFDSETGRLRKTEEQRGKQSKEELFWDILKAKTFVCCGCYMIKSDRFFEIYPDRHIPESPVGQNFQMLLPYMYRHKCPTISEPLYGVCVREGSHSRMKLMQEEEEKKYQDFERLVDEMQKSVGFRTRNPRGVSHAGKRSEGTSFQKNMDVREKVSVHCIAYFYVEDGQRSLWQKHFGVHGIGFFIRHSIYFLRIKIAVISPISREN